MPRNLYNCGNMVIASSGTSSTAILANPHFQGARALIIEAPDALTGIITVQVSVDGGSSYSNLQDGGADITIAAGDAVIITTLAFDAIRVQSGSSEGAERTFVVKAVEDL